MNPTLLMLTMKIEEETLAEEGTPVPHIKHGEE